VTPGRSQWNDLVHGRSPCVFRTAPRNYHHRNGGKPQNSDAIRPIKRKSNCRGDVSSIRHAFGALSLVFDARPLSGVWSRSLRFSNRRQPQCRFRVRSSASQAQEQVFHFGSRSLGENACASPLTGCSGDCERVDCATESQAWDIAVTGGHTSAGEFHRFIARCRASRLLSKDRRSCSSIEGRLDEIQGCQV